MDFYFTDRKYNLLGIGSTDGNGQWKITNDVETKSVDGGPAVTLAFDIRFRPEQEQAVNEMAKATNFVLYQDEEGNGHHIVINESHHDPLAAVHSVTGSDAGNDLINETVGAFKASKPMTIAEYINQFTVDSGWEIGANEFPGNVRTLEWTGEETSLARIIAVAKDFDAVLSFGFTLAGTNVVKRVINIKHEEAIDSQMTLHMNKEINNIVTSIDTYDMETSIRPVGGTPEGSDDPITLVGYKWTDPNGRFVLDSERGYLYDTVAVQQYSRLLSNSNPNPKASYWNRVKSFESNSQAALLNASLADLKKYNHPAESYDVDIAVNVTVPLNQKVHLVDENEQLFLAATVLKTERSRAMQYNKLTLGDFVHEQSSISEQLANLANQLATMPKTTQYYPWIRYADDDKGTNMSSMPTGKKYMAIVWSNKTAVPSDSPADYAGYWALIQGPKGQDGSNGTPGPKGADGRTSYFHTAWADSIDGKTGFTVSGGDGKKYIGTYTDFTLADSTNPASYNWALFKGNDGAQGPQGLRGPQGPQGPPGPQGVPGSKDVPYTYIQLGTPANPKKGDTWWHGTSYNDATALQYYDGSRWVDQSIQQAVLSIKKLQSIEVDSATINSPNINSPFNHVQIPGAKSSGNLELKDAQLGILGNIEDNSGKPNGQYYNTVLNPNGLTNYLTTPDRKGTMSSVGLQNGILQLQTLVGDPSAATKKYIQSEYTSADNVTYFYVNTNPYSNIDISWAYIYYVRRGNIVTVTFNMNMIANQYNYLRLATIRPGYTPYLKESCVCSCPSFSYPGQLTAMYSSMDKNQGLGWYGAISHGQGSYSGSFSYLTRDDYPLQDTYF